MSPIRLTILCEYATVSGGERSLLAALSQIPRDGFQITVLAPPAGPFVDEMKQSSIRCQPIDLFDSSGHRLPRELALEALTKAIDATQPDLIHANSLSMGRLTGAAAGRLPAPCTAHLRDIIRLTRAAVDDLNRNHALIAVSHATRDFHIQQGLDPHRTVVIYNGVDCEQFSPRPRSHRLRQEFGIPETAFLIASIGQICLRKGLDRLAQAAHINADSLPEAHYLLVGTRHSAKTESVELEKRIVRLFSDAGLRDRLHTTGFRNNIPQLLNAVDLLVHSALQEPLGRVLLEAAAAGTPIIATDVGGTSEILRDRQDALLIAPDDPALLARTIHLVARDRTLATQLARSARRRMAAEFNIRRRAMELASFWRNIRTPGSQT